MAAYALALDELGHHARETTKQEDEDAALILAAEAFDSPLYLGARAPFVKLGAAVREYSAVAGKINYDCVPVSGAYTRRPLAGFNPLTYAMQCPTYNEREGRDPLAHYLKAGRPEGPWVHSVVRFDETTLKNFASTARDKVCGSPRGLTRTLSLYGSPWRLHPRSYFEHAALSPYSHDGRPSKLPRLEPLSARVGLSPTYALFRTEVATWLLS